VLTRVISARAAPEGLDGVIRAAEELVTLSLRDARENIQRAGARTESG
jgi:hypothetical protein